MLLRILNYSAVPITFTSPNLHTVTHAPHTHTHTHTHTQTDMYIYTRMHHTHTHTQTCIYIHACTTHTHTHTDMYIYTRMHHTHLPPTHAHTYTHAPRIHTHTTHTHMHHTHMYIHTCTHTCTLNATHMIPFSSYDISLSDTSPPVHCIIKWEIFTWRQNFPTAPLKLGMGEYIH